MEFVEGVVMDLDKLDIHIGLNLHLFQIQQAESPSCPHCQGITVEMVKHYLLICPQYACKCHKL